MFTASPALGLLRGLFVGSPVSERKAGTGSGREAYMYEVLDTVDQWLSDGKKVAVATLIETERSAPRDPGAVLAVSDKMEVAGSVSGGCVEPAVIEKAMEVIDTGIPMRITHGITDEEACAVGLTCGGTVHLFVERLDY